MSMNYWNDMPAGYDAWLTTDVEGERNQERADYCADNHPDFDGEGECHECAAEEARWNEGEDPDDINDRRREEAYRDADMMIDPEAMEGN